jgi:hypothetical protein
MLCCLQQEEFGIEAVLKTKDSLRMKVFELTFDSLLL